MATWFGDFTAGIEAGEPTYSECTACGTATTPPRTRCPACGQEALEDQPLSEHAEVVAATEIHVSTPEFADETPYTVILAGFEEGVTLTGPLRGGEAVEIGDPVTLGTEAVGEDRRILTFTPE